MVRYVFVSLCLLLVMIVDIGVFCGGGEKEKQESRKRNTVDKDKASSRSKKIRFDVQQGDVTVSTASSLCSSENAVDIPSSDPTVREAVLPIFTTSGFADSLDTYGQEHVDDDDDERNIQNIMQTLTSQQQQTVCSSNDMLSGTWAPASALDTELDPMRLRLRQLRSYDGGALGMSSLDSTVTTTWPLQSSQAVGGSATTASTWSSSQVQWDHELVALNQRVDGMQQMMQQFISLVTPLMTQLNRQQQSNSRPDQDAPTLPLSTSETDSIRQLPTLTLQARNSRLGPAVRLRTTGTTTGTDNSRQMPTTTTDNLQTTTAAELAQQIQQLQRQQQALLAQWAYETQQWTGPDTLPTNLQVPNAGLTRPQLPTGLSGSFLSSPLLGRGALLPPLDSKIRKVST